MGKAFVQLFRTAKGVFVDPDATAGAVIGENLYVRATDGTLSLYDPTTTTVASSTTPAGTTTAAVSATASAGSNSGYAQDANPAAAPTNFDLDASMIAGLNNPAFPSADYILVGDGAFWQAVPMTGDAAIDSSGTICVSTVSKTATASGTNTYTASLIPVPVGYIAKVVYTITFTNANSGAATLNLNGLGAKAIQCRGAALTGGELRAGSTMALEYDGTQFQIVGEALGNVTNDTQTKAAIVPNTAPSPGQMLVGNAGGTAYAPVSMSGDATLASTGALTIANAAVTNAKQANMAAHTVKANITGSAAAPVDSSLSAILDAEIGSTRGMLLRRGSSAWQALSLGTSGQAVVSDGTDAKWGSVGGAAGGGLSFVGSATVTGSAQTSFSLSGLDLNTDQKYFVFITLKNATTTTALVSVYYNADTTAANYDVEGVGWSGTTTSAARANNAGVFNITSTAGGVNGCTNFFGWLSNDLDVKPRFNIFGGRDATTGILAGLDAHMWRTASTNVTSITVLSGVASSIAVGSKLEVWKLVAA